jgi:hydrogenase expression/formation protein HypD
MKYLDEYRDGKKVRAQLAALRGIVTRPWRIMEICGGQTHSLLKSGIDVLLPEQLTLIHGPGCPVCVTPLEYIDKAISLARRSDVILCSYGDMLRVPGSSTDLLTAKAEGGDIRIVYSPLDALTLAEQHPDRQVAFFSIGFETTAPMSAMAASQARQRAISNFSLLAAHVLVPPAIDALLSAPDCRIQGFLAPGHVCTITGYGDYEPLATKWNVPIVVTGFEPVDLLQGIHMLVTQLEAGTCTVQNQYSRAATRDGNESAKALMNEVFIVCDRAWRGIGVIAASGLRVADAYRDFDAEKRFDIASITADEPEVCIAGLVLQGKKRPLECPAFGIQCTPQSPLGAPMVSSEGACAAYFKYHRLQKQKTPPQRRKGRREL